MKSDKNSSLLVLYYLSNNGNTRIMYEIYSKLTTKTPERRHCFLFFWTDYIYCSGILLHDFEQVNPGWFRVLPLAFFLNFNFLFLQNLRNSRPEVFCKKSVFRNSAKFRGKNLCQGLFFNKVAGCGLQLYQNRGSDTSAFLWVLRNF